MGTLDDALSKTTAPENMTVYKAMNVGRLMNSGLDKYTPESELQKLVGKEFIDNSYGSTSSSATVALGFSTSNRIMVKIKVPKGSKGAWLGGSKEGEADRSTFNSEGELLLPRDRVYKITKISTITPGIYEMEQRVVELELMNYNHSPQRIK